MLRQRIITALILIPVTLALLFYLPSRAFLLLTGLITLAGAWEWSNLMEIKETSRRIIYLLLVALVFAAAIFVPTTYILACSFVWWLFATVLVLRYPHGSEWWTKNIYWRGLMGIFVLVPCLIAINYMREQNDGIYAILFLFVLIWGADSAAYFAGRLWGKNKLAPLVSPGKSIEGLIGALAFSTVIALIALWLCNSSLQILPWGVALSLLTVLFSVVGDLFESMMKRQANLKDSGKLLPGHGGLLDRIDSLTAAAPVFALGASMLGTYLN